MCEVNSHEPLRRIRRQGDYSPLPRELVTETTPCIIPPSSEHRDFLPFNFVSLPTVEEGHVTLKQQTTRGAMSSEEHSIGAKNWHHKAIRRNLSKAKELVLFVGGLKCNLPHSQYVQYATECARVTEKKSSIGPVFPTLGCLFVSFLSGTSAAMAKKRFRLTRFFGRIPSLSFLPYISAPQNTKEYNYDPLLVFINCKSGGGQGINLHDMVLKTLNPSQVFLLDKTGAMPGLYAFRKLSRFRVLVCGGDGTVGWVLSHLDKVQRYLHCPDPPIAVLPLGTGNDLARVLGYGSGWGGEIIDLILAQIHDADPVGMDRWNVMFDTVAETVLSPDPLLLSDAVSFRKGGGDDSEKPISPINIVMSLGGVDSQDTDQPVFNYKEGVRNLVSAAVPSVIWSKSPSGDSITICEKTMSKNNNHCDPSDVLQPNLIEVQANSESNSPTKLETTTLNTQHIVSLDKLTLETDKTSSGQITPDILPADRSSTDKITQNVPRLDETSDNANNNKLKNIRATTAPVQYSSESEDTIPDHSTADNTTRKARDDSVTHYAANIQSDGITTNDEITVDETMAFDFAIQTTEQNVTMDNATSENLTSINSDVSGDVSPSLLRPRSRSSSRRRLVQILSASDLDFGPFMAYEEDNPENIEDSHEQLKRKASLLKLVDSSDAKDNESEDSIPAETEDPGDDLNTSSTEPEVVFHSLSSSNDTNSHPSHILRMASETAVVKRDHHPISTNKKLSLPVSRNFADVNRSPSPEPESGVKLVVMNNYFGIGIDAELTLAFHLAREENPEKCTSRLRNKALYFKAGLKKMTSRSVNLNNVIELEVNNKVINLPSIRGLIFLNISSWGAGAKPWGSGVSKRFDPPSFGDGMLEVIGVGGVAHMSQIYSGLRTGTRLAQGEFIKMTVKAEVAVQIDGEPWMQPPGQIVISASPHQAMMLKRNKKKSK